MTVMRLTGDRLLLHSPVALDPELRGQLDALGGVCYVVAPNRVHHLHAGEVALAYPKARLWIAPGLERKRPDLQFAAVLTDDAPEEWRAEVAQVFFRGRPYENEVAFYHRESRTLLLCDLGSRPISAPSTNRLRAAPSPNTLMPVPALEAGASFTAVGSLAVWTTLGRRVSKAKNNTPPPNAAAQESARRLPSNRPCRSNAALDEAPLVAESPAAGDRLASSLDPARSDGLTGPCNALASGGRKTLAGFKSRWTMPASVSPPHDDYDPRIASQGAAIFTKPVSIGFATGSDVLDSAALATVNREILPQAEMAREMSLRIEGNTDNVGDAAMNQGLSERRARAIVDYLVLKGVARSRLSARGNGMRNPAASNRTPEGRARNRRTDVLFIGSL